MKLILSLVPRDGHEHSLACLWQTCSIVALASVSTLAAATPDVINATNSTVPGIEDTPVPLNLQLDPAFFTGGKQLDVLATEVGFRDASASSAATFTVPAEATFVRIRAAGGNNGPSTGTREEEFLLTDITVDLVKQTYSGQLRNIFDGSIANSNYAFTGAALGSDSASGTTTGAPPTTAVTVSLAGNTLTISDNQTVNDQAYLVEYLSAENTSSDFLGNAGVVLAGSVLSNSVTLPAGSDFLDVKILDGRSNSNFRHEDKG